MKSLLLPPEMIKMVVDGSKTVTRRLGITSRYHPGELVNIKEAWATEKQYDHLPPRSIPRTAKIFYVADGVGEWPLDLTIGKLRSPLFMPEKFARSFIRIVSVNPERLQNLTKEDCKLEGIPGYIFAKGCLSSNPPDPRWAFIALWDSINQQPGTKWADNPLVFRYEFKLVAK